jgi:hypothetical protein
MKKMQPVTPMNQQSTSLIEHIQPMIISFINNIHMMPVKRFMMKHTACKHTTTYTHIINKCGRYTT